MNITKKKDYKKFIKTLQKNTFSPKILIIIIVVLLMIRAYTRNELITMLVEKGYVTRMEGDTKYSYIYALTNKIKKLETN